MRKLFRVGLFVLFLTVFTVTAQDVRLNININDGEETTTVSASSSVSGNDYTLNYKMHPKGKSFIKVLSPDGATARILSRKTVVVTDTIPFSFKAKGDAFYTVEITLQGKTWSKKIEAKDGMIAILKVTNLHSGSTKITVVNDPPRKKHHNKKRHHSKSAMSNSQFQSLLSAIKNESFDKGQLNILKDAMQHKWVTSNQVGQIIDIFSFAASKVKAGTICYPRVVDKDNFYTVYSHFTFSGSKDKLRENIKDLK